MNRFEFRPDITSIFDTMIAIKIATFFPGKCYTVSYGESRFGILEVHRVSSDFTICDMAPESGIKISLSRSWFDIFAMNNSS